VGTEAHVFPNILALYSAACPSEGHSQLWICVQVFFSALIDVAGHSGQLDQAFSILQEMKRLGMKPGAVVYSSLMGVCSNVSTYAFNLTVQNNLGFQCLFHFMVAYAPPNSTKGLDDLLV
jgi:pentatricopeptide repeat protein